LKAAHSCAGSCCSDSCQALIFSRRHTQHNSSTELGEQGAPQTAHFNGRLSWSVARDFCAFSRISLGTTLGCGGTVFLFMRPVRRPRLYYKLKRGRPCKRLAVRRPAGRLVRKPDPALTHTEGTSGPLGRKLSCQPPRHRPPRCGCKSGNAQSLARSSSVLLQPSSLRLPWSTPPSSPDWTQVDPGKMSRNRKKPVHVPGARQCPGLATLTVYA
jgi:hypothetical protein